MSSSSIVKNDLNIKQWYSFYYSIKCSEAGGRINDFD